MSGQGDLACCGSWGHKESDTTEWLSWTEPHLAVRLLRPIRERGESTGNHIEERIQLWSRRFRFILTPDCKTNLLLRKMRCRCPLLSWLESIFTDLPLVRTPVPAFPLLKTTSPRWHLPEHDSSQLLLFCLWIYADTVPLLKMPFLALFLKHLKVKVKLLSCPTFCHPVDCNWPGSSIHGIFQARILEWVAIFFSRGSSWHRDWTQVSRIAGKLFTLWATGEHLLIVKYSMATLVV